MKDFLQVEADYSLFLQELKDFKNLLDSSRFLSEWSPRFERGFSQIVDWFYKLDTQSETRDFEYRFGGRSLYSMGLLIIGRDADLSDKEKDRLEWRKRKLLVNSNHIYCLTFDDLYRTLAVRRDIYNIFANSDRDE